MLDDEDAVTGGPLIHHSAFSISEEVLVMPRAKRGNKRTEKRKKILDLAKGYRGTKSKLYRSAKESVERRSPTSPPTRPTRSPSWPDRRAPPSTTGRSPRPRVNRED